MITSSWGGVTFDGGQSFLQLENRMWDLSSGASVLELNAKGTLQITDWSSDGTRLAAWSIEGVQVLDAATGKVRVALQGAKPGRGVAVFSPDGSRICSASADNTLHMWETSTGKMTLTLRGPGIRVGSLAFGPDGTQVAASCDDGSIWVFDAQSGDVLSTHLDRGAWGATFTTDGTEILSLPDWDAPAEERRIRVFDPFVDGSQALEGTGGSAIAFSPDGKRAAAGTLDAYLDSRGTTYDSAVRLWDTETGELLAVLRGHRGAVQSVAFSSDGRRIISGSGEDKTIRLWDCSSGECILTINGGLPLSVHPQDTEIAYYDSDSLRIWDFGTRRVRLSLPIPGRLGRSICYSPDGERLAAARGREILMWNAATGRRVWGLSLETAKATAIAFSPDGAELALGCSDGTIKTFRASDGSSVASLIGHATAVSRLAYWPDGARLASVAGTAAFVWDTATREVVLVLSHQVGAALAISPDGKSMATAPALSSIEEGHVRLWRAKPAADGAERRRSFYLRRAGARPIVDSLFSRFPTSDLVIEHLLQNGTLNPEVRETAIRMARIRGGDPDELNRRSWEIVRLPGRSESQYREALGSAQKAYDLNPRQAANLRSVGVAHLRLGDWDNAVRELARADTMNTFASGPEGGGVPSSVAFLAMALYRSGQRAQAEEALQRLEALMKMPAFAGDDQCRACYAEARECRGVR
jgi:WD40 repeat protein